MAGGLAPLAGCCWAVLGLVLVAAPFSPLSSFVSAGSADVTPKEFVVVSAADAVEGRSARLPCDLTPSLTGDQVWLVIWYREGNSKPCYSYDARLKTDNKSGTHWADEKAFAGQVTFRENESPAHLVIENVRDSDGGAYRCRVDFARSPTRNARVNLTVIVPPERLQIVDHNGTEMRNSVLGPYEEGSSVNVTCISFGGSPAPRVTWWQENALLDDTSERLGDGRVQNTMNVVIERRTMNMAYTCQAANNNLESPVSIEVIFDLALRASSVTIRNYTRPMSADRQHQLACDVVGARPLPDITWWRGSQKLTKTRTVVSNDNQTVTSYLTFIPSREDADKTLFCRAETPGLPHDKNAKEGSIKLNVTYIPYVSVYLPAPVVDEGAGASLYCNVVASPPPTKIEWRHNGVPVNSSSPSGMQASNFTLMLQSVRRSSAGSYVCTAINSEGSGTSSTATLEVRFVPVCRGQRREEHARPGGTINVQCPVITFHQDTVSYRWALLDTRDAKQRKSPVSPTRPPKDNAIPAASTVSSVVGKQDGNEEQLASKNDTIRYTVHEFGTLLCWARGALGEMQQPCSIKIQPEAGKPDPPADCSIPQTTSRSVTVTCSSPGYAGATPRHYSVEAYDASDHRLLQSVTNATAYWLVDNLPANKNITLMVFSTNAKGRSSELKMIATTLHAPQPVRGATAGASRASMPLGGLLVPLLATVSGVVVLAAVIVAILRLRGRGEGNDEKAGSRRRGAGGADGGASGGGGGGEGRGCELAQDTSDRDSQPDNSKEDLIQRDEKDPDVIPYKTDLEYLDEDEKAFQYLHQNSTLRMRGPSMGMGHGPSVVSSMQPLLASNLRVDQSPSAMAISPVPPLQPDYQPDYQPEYQPDYQTDYQPDYQPDYQAGYQAGYQPQLQPAYPSGYQTLQSVLHTNGKPAMAAMAPMPSVPSVQPHSHCQVQGFGTIRRTPHHLHHLPHPVVEPEKNAPLNTPPRRSSPPLSHRPQRPQTGTSTTSTNSANSNGTCSSPDPSDAGSERAPLLSVTPPQPMLATQEVPPPRIYRDTKF